MAESIASLRRVSMTGSITWNSKKTGCWSGRYCLHRHPKFLSGFEIWYKKKIILPASVWTYQIDEYPWWSWCQECHSVQWFYRDILLSWLFSFSHPLSKIEVFSFFETASLYLVYCLLIVYARCRFQKHKFFNFLKVETM